MKRGRESLKAIKSDGTELFKLAYRMNIQKW